MRDQYKLLAEKYQLILEDDKDDIMAGLEYLSVDPDEPMTTDNLERIGFFVKDFGNGHVYYVSRDSDEIFLQQKSGDWMLFAVVGGKPAGFLSGFKTIGQLSRAYDKIQNILSSPGNYKDPFRAYMKGITWDRDEYGSYKIISHWKDIEKKLEEVFKENDREDIMAGLDALEYPPIIYYISQHFARYGGYKRSVIKNTTPADIEEFYADENNVIDYQTLMGNQYKDYNELMDIIISGEVAELAGENHGYFFCTNPGKLQAYVEQWEEAHGFDDNEEEEDEEVVQENDKEDIMAGLEDALGLVTNRAYRFTYKNITAERYNDRSRYFAMRTEFPHSYATSNNIVEVPPGAKPLPPISPNEPFDKIYYRVAARAAEGPGIKIEVFIKDDNIIDLILNYNGDDPVADLEFEIDNYCGDHDVLWRVHNLPEVKEAEHHFNPNTLEENDKEDIMAGLDELSDLPKVIHGAMLLYSRTKFFFGTLGEVMEKFFDETSLNYFCEWNPAGYPPPNIEELKRGLATEGVYVLYGEDYEVVLASDKAALNAKIEELRHQQFDAI